MNARGTGPARKRKPARKVRRRVAPAAVIGHDFDRAAKQQIAAHGTTHSKESL